MDWANLVITYDGPQRSVKEDVILSSIALAGSILAQTNTSPDFLAFYLRILHAITPYPTFSLRFMCQPERFPQLPKFTVI